MKLIKRNFNDSDSSYFLFGPRGTGKSTWLKQTFPQAVYIDFLNPETFRFISAKPERLKSLIDAEPQKETVIIDEVQKFPEILDVVHLLIESNKQNKKLKFILTGSSSRKLKKQGIDLLSGRALVKRMYPFMASEMGKNFDLNYSLKHGTIPLVLSSTDPLSTLNTYISLYIREEVFQEGLVRKAGPFSRFLETISFSQASQVNISNISRDSEVKRKTIYNYLDILYDLLIAFTIPVFTRKAKRNLITHPKFYFFDCGVYKAIRPTGLLEPEQPLTGISLETLIAQHLLAWIDYSNYQLKLYYWRTRTGTEVDFIIYGKEGFWAIEVKNTLKVRKSDLKSLKTFIHDYPQALALFLYRGNRKLLIDKIHCIPIQDFLLNLIPHQLLLNQ